ncbi:MAG: toll/interleukin-1 receptor domain-containing protein [Candidatus Moduliflexus flocculans]|nr:toll/interleukin-1 receptor domain-containing protein [Candidatus Moduliflexus flocculans]
MPSDDRPITVFYSYAHADEKLRDELAKHLSLLKNQGYIQEWHDRDIEAGQEWEGRVDQHLAAAQFILLLISPDFMVSRYCYSIELKRAMERHAAGEARVVPIILKPVDWQSAPFGQLQALPKNAKRRDDLAESGRGVSRHCPGDSSGRRKAAGRFFRIAATGPRRPPRRPSPPRPPPGR